MNPGLSIFLDVVILVFVTGLIAIFVVLTRGAIAKFFVLPYFLLCIHVCGNTMQELEIGPAPLRNHLHNLGVAGVSMIFALTGVLRMKRCTSQYYQRLKDARWAMNTVMLNWIVFTLLGIGEEVLNGTLWSEKAKLDGYSGQIDWTDILAYVIGALVVVVNYWRQYPRVIVRLQND